MLFTSWQYAVFLLAVFAVYWALPWHRARVWLLLAASFGFYACWNRWLALLVCGSASLDWLLALAIERATGRRQRRLLLAVSVTANLGLLCYFKYVNFFLDSLGQLLRAAGAETSLPVLSVLLPVGISFYTFEAISYVIDVHQGRLRAERNLPNFLLFILFFPHLVAGPIVRGRDFLPQVRRAKRFSWARVLIGVLLILAGLIKKWVVADRMAHFVDPIYADPAGARCLSAWLAVFAYALQVYGDFSGYTDMALGSAHLFGFHLAANFDRPYLSTSIADFWRRWHISLSSWLRDYLFFPLGGSRGGFWLVARNLLVVMTLCGLWHGAAWNFVLFGLLQGLLLLGHKLFRDHCRGTWLEAVLLTPSGTVARIVCTFTCFSLSLVVFRAGSLAEMAGMYSRLCTPAPGGLKPMPAYGLLLTVALVVLLQLLDLVRWRRLLEEAPPLLVGASCAALGCLALLFVPGGAPPFIYFQF